MRQFLPLLFLLLHNIASGQSIVVQPYLQNADTSSMTVMWETATAGVGTVQFGSSPFALNQTATSITNNVFGNQEIHTAVLSNLAVGSKYYYKVVMADGQSTTVKAFKTLPSPSQETNSQFFAISDMQRDGSFPDKFREIAEDGIVTKAHDIISSDLTDIEGILIPGDLVATGGNYSQWKNNFFDPADSLFGYVPVYPVPGNHEYFGNGLSNFKHYFNMPTNGIASLPDECWFKDISNVRVVGLNSNSGSADQTSQLNWLQTVLDDACTNEHIDFVFAQLHHPYKSELWTPGENDFTGQVIDSLEQFTTTCQKASLHFFGHTHAYSRGQSRDHKHLWVNVATAGGAIDNWGEFPNADYKEFVKSQDEYGFVYMEVEAGAEPQFTLQRFGRGDQNAIADNILRDEVTLSNEENPPTPPEGVFPKGDTISANCLKLKASDIYGIKDTLQASHWQIATDSLFQNTIVAEDWWQNENWYNEVDQQQDDDLTDATFSSFSGTGTHYWRVRYRNQTLDWSDWSPHNKMFLVSSGSDISTNLLTNAGAENGTADWIGDIESLQNAACSSVPPFAGNYNFAVGGVCANESSFGTAYQEIDLSVFQSQIAADTVAIAFNGYLRNFSGNDLPEILVELYAGNTVIVVSEILSNNTAQWTQIAGVVDAPPTTTKCRFVLQGTRNAGSDNDSYFDELDLRLVTRSSCVDCFGKSEIDNDNDGFCSDIDCDDSDESVYPGAFEQCDGQDNNCDGFFETSDTVTWVGGPLDSLWSVATSWGQGFAPLPCQHVIISSNSKVVVDGRFQCRSILVEATGKLIVPADSEVSVNNLMLNSDPSLKVQGTMEIYGACEIQDSRQNAIEVSGLLINFGKLKTAGIVEKQVVIKSGGRFESLGLTKFR